MNRKGFTLIELLIVVAIIGIIAAIAIPNLLVALQKGKQKSTMGDMKSIGNAVESYLTDWSIVPRVGPGLANILNTAWFTPFYIKILPITDAWGTMFTYSPLAALDEYTVESQGRDKVDTPPGPDGLIYNVKSISDFNYDLTFSNGFFIEGPRVKK
jgi:general secretion pathway protein G